MQKYLLSVRTLAAAAAVIAASMPFAMIVVVIAEKVQPDFERACQIFFCSFADIAGSAADDFDIGGFQSIDRTAADTSADNNINIFRCQQRSQRAVSGIAAFK